MLEEIQEMGGVDAIPAVLARAKDKSDPFRLMGFGHRVYKTYDPRAKLMRQVTYKTLETMGVECVRLCAGSPCLCLGRVWMGRCGPSRNGKKKKKRLPGREGLFSPGVMLGFKTS